MKAFVKLTNPLLQRGGRSRRIPAAAAHSAVCGVVFLYGAVLLMPYLLGYSVMGMLSFPLEGEIAAAIYALLTPDR